MFSHLSEYSYNIPVSLSIALGDFHGREIRNQLALSPLIIVGLQGGPVPRGPTFIYRDIAPGYYANSARFQPAQT